MLTDEEIHVLTNAAMSEENRFSVCILLATGVRASELFTAQQADVFLDAARWHIPASKAGPAMDIPLAPIVVEWFERLARRDALSSIQSHRLGTADDDPTTVLKSAVQSGKVIAVIEQRRSSGAGSRSSNEPRPRSITFTPSQLFRGTARMARGTGASPPALPRLPAEDGLRDMVCQTRRRAARWHYRDARCHTLRRCAAFRIC
ncbi:tyrosine-type recombinase/integrase [Paraburkholderia sp.]|jgi:integrase|uniref:tyrosine-type recombinase/integrase n=1 Tax=Paraburkholderia sp. TaxID=1926495 RepID=UPI002F4156F5